MGVNFERAWSQSMRLRLVFAFHCFRYVIEYRVCPVRSGDVAGLLDGESG